MEDYSAISLRCSIVALLLVTYAFSTLLSAGIVPGRAAQIQSQMAPSVPIQTDDGQDPVNLIFTGYAPSWWVASNLAGWSDSAYCSGSKALNGNEYNYTLETPDPTGVPCFGPRDHVRIWDMGYNPTFGYWSVGSAHHEHTECNPVCHHVIDSWDRAEANVSSAFLGGQSTVSMTNYTLRTASLFQGVPDDGNATLIQLKRPMHYPVIFNEKGLNNQTSWSVTVNGTTTSSRGPAIVIEEPNGTYSFTIGTPPGFTPSPSSGLLKINGQPTTENIDFLPPTKSPSLIPSPLIVYFLTGAITGGGILTALFLALKLRQRNSKQLRKPR